MPYVFISIARQLCIYHGNRNHISYHMTSWVPGFARVMVKACIIEKSVCVRERERERERERREREREREHHKYSHFIALYCIQRFCYFHSLTGGTQSSSF